MKRAVHLLTVRARSRHEMKDRLLGAGFDDPTAEAVEIRLLNAGLLDDAAFAAQVVRRGVEAGKSSRLTRQELVKCGIDAEIAEASLCLWAGEAQEGDEDRALRLAESKAAACRNLPVEKAIPRVVQQLCGKGYEPQLAWEVARKVFRETEFPSD